MVSEMKVGTLSLNINTDDLNYGAILHSWAFQKVLLSLEGVDTAEVIDYVPVSLESFQRFSPVLSYLRLKRWKSAGKAILSRRQYLKRLNEFERFRKEKMIVSSERYTQSSLEQASIEYDCLICESDVIWSPHFFGGYFDKTFFLDMENMRDKKKIIYAASMANGMNNNQAEQFRRLILAPDNISCRERYAVQFVNEYTERHATHVVDPVLLLDAKDYELVCAPRLVKEPYILVYVPLDYDRRYQKTAKKYAKKYGLKVVEISYYVWHGVDHKVMAAASVEEFISLIRYADIVFTNSFHAVCFSLVFNKEFYAFSRKTGKKTEDICDWTGLLDRYMDIGNFSERKPICYDEVNAKVKEKQKQSFVWLKDAIGIEDKYD